MLEHCGTTLLAGREIRFYLHKEFRAAGKCVGKINARTHACTLENLQRSDDLPREARGKFDPNFSKTEDQTFEYNHTPQTTPARPTRAHLRPLSTNQLVGNTR